MKQPHDLDYPYADAYLNGRETPVAIPPRECPCCIRGRITAGICDRCHVAVAEGSTEREPIRRNGGRRRRADQNDLKPMGDYVATKQDQQ